jgi:uncharacterized protein YegP (UPF0339 family)
VTAAVGHTSVRLLADAPLSSIPLQMATSTLPGSGQHSSAQNARRSIVAGTFVVQKGKKGQFHFTLKAPNHKVILTSETYANKGGSSTGIEAVRKASKKDDRFERKAAKNGAPYFVLKAANGKVIGTSQMYASTQTMERGIASVKLNAAKAKVVEPELK